MRGWLFGVALLLAVPAFAVLPDEVLQDPALEARARTISQELRCVVCQNQTIDDSDAPLARDLRILVRERLVKGDTDAQTLQYMVDRYGSYVLLKPPLAAETLALWLGPLAFVVLGGIGVAVYFARRREPRNDGAALDAAETARVEALLREG